MTAAGFVMFLVGFIGVNLTNISWLEKAWAFAALTGLILFCGGIAVWLWKHMP